MNMKGLVPFGVGVIFLFSSIISSTAPTCCAGWKLLKLLNKSKSSAKGLLSEDVSFEDHQQDLEEDNDNVEAEDLEAEDEDQLVLSAREQLDVIRHEDEYHGQQEDGKMDGVEVVLPGEVTAQMKDHRTDTCSLAYGFQPPKKKNSSHFVCGTINNNPFWKWTRAAKTKWMCFTQDVYRRKSTGELKYAYSKKGKCKECRACIKKHRKNYAPLRDKSNLAVATKNLDCWCSAICSFCCGHPKCVGAAYPEVWLVREGAIAKAKPAPIHPGIGPGPGQTNDRGPKAKGKGAGQWQLGLNLRKRLRNKALDGNDKDPLNLMLHDAQKIRTKDNRQDAEGKDVEGSREVSTPEGPQRESEVSQIK